jgi:hypothetical protein
MVLVDQDLPVPHRPVSPRLFMALEDTYDPAAKAAKKGFKFLHKRFPKKVNDAVPEA